VLCGSLSGCSFEGAWSRWVTSGGHWIKGSHSSHWPHAALDSASPARLFNRLCYISFDLIPNLDCLSDPIHLQSSSIYKPSITRARLLISKLLHPSVRESCLCQYPTSPLCDPAQLFSARSLNTSPPSSSTDPCLDRHGTRL
jgi:hypothetical protein